jgi:hypothetical protein
MISETEYNLRTLLQFGFSRDQTFASLIKDNRYIYRVHSASSLPLVEGIGIVASGCKDLSLEELDGKRRSLAKEPPVDEAFQRVARSESTSLICATFSLTWAIYEANRRTTTSWRPYPAKLTVIDGHLLHDYASTAVELLKLDQSRKSFQMLERFANAAQEVLIYAFIPEEAILVTIPWDRVFTTLPSWYLDGGNLRKDLDDNYPLSCRSQFQAFATAFAESSQKNETLSREESIKLAIVIMGDLMKSSASVVEFDNVENTITDLATEILRWPQRLHGHATLAVREIWDRKRTEISDMVRADQRLSARREHISLEEGVRKLCSAWEEIKSSISTVQHSKEQLLE